MISRSRIIGLQNHSEKHVFLADYFDQLLGITGELATFFCAVVTHLVKIPRIRIRRSRLAEGHPATSPQHPEETSGP